MNEPSITLRPGKRPYSLLAREYVRSLWNVVRAPPPTADLETFCLFIGYSRSGHSLVGSLLDAHPDAVIAHELDALRLVDLRFSRAQIAWLILENDRKFTDAGRRWTGYAYRVPNQWQGKVRRMRVMGDKLGGPTTKRLARRPHLLDRVPRALGLRARYVHVVRNPYDNITTMARRRRPQAFEHVVGAYFRLARANAKLRRRLAPGALLDVRLEDMVADPRTSVRKLCAFVDLPVTDDYVEDCASIVFSRAKRTRNDRQWSPGELALVAAGIARHDFLAGYTFDG